MNEKKIQVALLDFKPDPGQPHNCRSGHGTELLSDPK
jgi:hypothetical protein